MLYAMVTAPVGDDVWGDDPTVNLLESEAAAMFGKEAGLFCPSGTMTNQSRQISQLFCVIHTQ
jgi:threonine aldolase